MFCRIVNGRAVDVVGSYKNCFHPSLHSEFVACPVDVQHGWVYDADEDTWSAPPEPEEEESSE
mgnify:CR=1 FL=1